MTSFPEHPAEAAGAVPGDAVSANAVPDNDAVPDNAVALAPDALREPALLQNPRPVRQMHLAVELSAAVAARAADATLPDFAAYVRLAQTAERGLFDFVLIGDGPVAYGEADGEAPSEADGPPAGLLGRPDPFTVLNALAAVTRHIGLVAAVSPVGRGVPGTRSPDELARRIAALDRLSAGRAGGPVLAVPDLTAPSGPQGRPVAVGGPGVGDAPAEVLVLTGAVERPRPGVKVLARIDFTRTVWSTADPSDPPALADRLAARVRSGEVDGYVLTPQPVPGGHGLDVFVDRLVPLLQTRGIFRTAYRGATLRDHLGLPAPVPPTPV